MGINRIMNTAITETSRLICYDQITYDDIRLEVAEYAGLALAVRVEETSVQTKVEPMYDNVAIRILDNDSEL